MNMEYKNYTVDKKILCILYAYKQYFNDISCKTINNKDILFDDLCLSFYEIIENEINILLEDSKNLFSPFYIRRDMMTHILCNNIFSSCIKKINHHNHFIKNKEIQKKFEDRLNKSVEKIYDKICDSLTSILVKEYLDTSLNNPIFSKNTLMIISKICRNMLKNNPINCPNIIEFDIRIHIIICILYFKINDDDIIWLSDHINKYSENFNFMVKLEFEILKSIKYSNIMNIDMLFNSNELYTLIKKNQHGMETLNSLQKMINICIEDKEDCIDEIISNFMKDIINCNVDIIKNILYQ